MMSTMRLRCLLGLGALATLLATGAASEEILHRERSLYRNIVVYEDQGLRCMSFGRNTLARQSCVSLTNRDELIFNYTRMIMASLYLNPAPKRILIVGLGGGTLVHAFQRLAPDAEIDAVEIDDAVVQVARKYFGLESGPRTRISVEDGRVFVKRAQRRGEKYDLIVLDAFDHEYIPEHMLTREFLIEVRSLLSDRGVLAGNTFSTSKLFDHESATYYSVFGDFFGLKQNNRVILVRLGDLPAKADIVRNADLLDARLKPLGIDKAWLLPQIVIEHDWPAGTRVLTDQYSPSNLLNSGR